MTTTRDDTPSKPTADAGKQTTDAAAPGTDGKPRSDNNAAWDKDDEPWRHAPVAPKDANPLDSLGRSITDAITGSAPDKSDTKKP